jgi:Ca-activated chloride channel family protein
LEAAQQAVDRGVRVYTIGFGTAQGSIMNCSPQYQNGGLFGGGGGGFGFGGGGGFRRGIDEDTLMRIADMTGGTYYSAESAGELQDVFENLPTYLITRQETTEISVAFAAVGAVMAALAILLSLIWHPLP